MTRDAIRAKAVAYHASRDPRHYRDLRQSDLEDFWGEVTRLRIRGEYPPLVARLFDAIEPGWDTAPARLAEHQRLYDAFWSDQRGEVTA